MDHLKILEGKRILIVDDEPDILETLEELLDVCQTDSASSFESAVTLLKRTPMMLSYWISWGLKDISFWKSPINLASLPLCSLPMH